MLRWNSACSRHSTRAWGRSLPRCAAWRRRRGAIFAFPPGRSIASSAESSRVRGADLVSGMDRPGFSRRSSPGVVACRRVAQAMSEIILVVPVYNEAQRLVADPWLQYLAVDRSRALYFVDDGSTDGTVQLLEQLLAHAPTQVTILRLPQNAGKAEAVRTGMVRALADTPLRCAGFARCRPRGAAERSVASLQDELGISRRRSAWAAFGSRAKLLGRHIVRSERRHYVGRVFATCASMAVGLPVYDTQCGLKLFRATPEVAGTFAEPFKSKWIFDVELLARLADAAGRCRCYVGASARCRSRIGRSGAMPRPRMVRDSLRAPVNLHADPACVGNDERAGNDGDGSGSRPPAVRGRGSSRASSAIAVLLGLGADPGFSDCAAGIRTTKGRSLARRPSEVLRGEVLASRTFGDPVSGAAWRCPHALVSSASAALGMMTAPGDHFGAGRERSGSARGSSGCWGSGLRLVAGALWSPL